MSAATGRAGVAPAGRAGTRPASRRDARRSRTPEQLARSFADLFCEVEAGRRPRRHLQPAMDPVLYHQLAPAWVRPGPVPVVVTIWGVRTGGIYDAVALLRRGTRVGALCLRLVRGAGGWQVTEAARPEDGVLPTPQLDPPDHELEEYGLVSPR